VDRECALIVTHFSSRFASRLSNIALQVSSFASLPLSRRYRLQSERKMEKLKNARLNSKNSIEIFLCNINLIINDKLSDVH